jgi:hypothetical protein
LLSLSLSSLCAAGGGFALYIYNNLAEGGGVEPILTKATVSKIKEIHFCLKFRTSEAIYMI